MDKLELNIWFGRAVCVLCLFLCWPVFAQVSVEDYLGRQVTLNKPATRVIALAPHIVENIASAGAFDALVGVVDYSDYPPQAKDIPRVGAVSQFSLEAIVASKPDLVIVWMSTKGGEVLHDLDKLKISTYANDPRDLKDVARSIRDYGVLMGTRQRAEKNAQQYLDRLARLQKDYQRLPTVKVMYQVWFDPLQTLNDDHIISDVIRLCGGVNAFGGLPGIAPKISVESVIAQNPDVIVASGMGQGRPDWLDDWSKWPNLKAVKNQHVYFIPPDIIQRHTVRILDGAEMMCNQLDQVRGKQATSLLD